MNNDRVDIKAAFLEALEKRTPAERTAYLAGVCGDDPGLRAEFESLLRAHDRAGDFLETPPLDFDGTCDASPLSEGPGTVIGRYKLLEKIGEGGMAVVYMAEQTEPIRRKVALKIIKLGMDTRQVIARFEAERQALALMDHPSIAKVFDAGATETGRPYFVMELVSGVSITEYCDKSSLSTKDRLALFLQVCHAVQHAHQKGIIHRDIKPSNVMVTHHDGKPIPKVIDFGIAKATNQKLTEKTLFTRYAHLIGTPAYMSPEQAELSDLDIDTRSDIYSLGVLLYELLTGTTPFSEEELRRAGYIEMQRVIREQEPVKPSTRIRTATRDRRSVGAGRVPKRDKSRLGSPPCACPASGGHGGPPLREVRGDLDWIVMKSLEKDRARRYETASGLAEDIRRHLEHEPVLARPPSRWYRSRKLLQRHGRLAALLVGVAGLSLLATVVSTSLYVHMRRALHTVSTLENQADVDRRLSAARGLYARGQPWAALKELEATPAERDPGPVVHLFHAQLLIELQRGKEAQGELLALTQAEPEIAATAHYLLARAYLGQDKVKASEHEALATAMMPETAEAYFLRAMTAPNPEEALAWVDRAISVDASHYPARKARALIYYCRGADEKAVEDVAALIALRPKNYLGYALRAVQRRESAQLEAALLDHARALDLCENDADRAEIHGQRYVTHLRRGDYASALQDARRLAELCPQMVESRFCIVVCLVGMGDYAAAQREYRTLVQTSAAWDRAARQFLITRVLQALTVGQTFRIPPEIADKAPFAAIRKAVDCCDSLRRHAVRVPIAPRQGVIAYGWSPDGKKLLCGSSGFYLYGTMSRTIQGGTPGFFSEDLAVKIIDIESGREQRVPVTSWGGGLAWSPDGRCIAYGDTNGNVCLIAPEGGTPRVVPQAAAPQWSRDSQHLYFLKSPGDGMVYRLDIRDPHPTPVEVTRSWGTFLPCEPRGWMAVGSPTSVDIVDLASQSVLHRCPWPWPLPLWPLRGSPNGKELAWASWKSYIHLGPLVLDTETKELYEVLDYPADQILWSPDGSKIVIAIMRSIWILNADPNLPLGQRLGRKIPNGDLVAHELAKLSRALAADPSYPENYLERAVAYLTTGRYPEAESDLQQFEALVTGDDHHIGYELFSWLKECYGNDLLDAAARLEPYAEKFIERFPAEVPSYRSLLVEMVTQHERKGRTELADRWRAKLKESESRRGG